MDTNAVNDIRDIKGMVPVPHAWWPVWVATGVIVAGVLAWWLWRRYRRGPTAAGTPAPPPPLPYEVALAALAELRGANLPVELFYTRLSDIVRRYIEGRFGLRAPEQTTEEFLAQATLPAEHMDLLSAFLTESDLVKFARLQPGDADRQQAFAAAEKFVLETK
jgi:hypothetical protein